jgi:hypothetical protein
VAKENFDTDPDSDFNLDKYDEEKVRVSAHMPGLPLRQ